MLTEVNVLQKVQPHYAHHILAQGYMKNNTKLRTVRFIIVLSIISLTLCGGDDVTPFPGPYRSPHTTLSLLGFFTHVFAPSHIIAESMETAYFR